MPGSGRDDVNHVPVPINGLRDLSNRLVVHEHLITIREHEQLRRVHHINIEPALETY